MANLIRLGTIAEMPPEGEAREFEVGGKTVCVSHTSEGLAAMDNVCVHRGGPLGQGVVDGNKIICPWHGWMFDVNTGACAFNAEVRIPVYPLKIEGDEVYVALDE